MTQRQITITLDIPGAPGDSDGRHDELYADTANAVWMTLKATSEPDRFDYDIAHDNDHHGLAQELNDRWDVYGKDAQWS
ncbi:hypothetical protein Rwratislav_33481 [Rhodococcus wratislaviensis IFP 2016]|nr:hypothetical protein Rwratislav_33481 [Rhodococcus wratislaviensis IFP 2016]